VEPKAEPKGSPPDPKKGSLAGAVEEGAELKGSLQQEMYMRTEADVKHMACTYAEPKESKEKTELSAGLAGTECFSWGGARPPPLPGGGSRPPPLGLSRRVPCRERES
jgi:hypothetical protein